MSWRMLLRRTVLQEAFVGGVDGSSNRVSREPEVTLLSDLHSPQQLESANLSRLLKNSSASQLVLASRDCPGLTYLLPFDAGESNIEVSR
jgi:hypothetical protein